MRVRISLEIYLDYYLFPVVVKHNITYTAGIFHPENHNYFQSRIIY